MQHLVPAACVIEVGHYGITGVGVGRSSGKNMTASQVFENISSEDNI
jgi:hypothetical protein